MDNLVFLGAGTAFYEIYDLIQDINQQEQKYKIIAILDDNEDSQGMSMNGIKVEGGLFEAKNYLDAKFVFGIGSIKTRKDRETIINSLGIPFERFVSLVHPDAKIYSSATIGNGCIIHCGCLVGSSAIVEDFSIMTFNSILGCYSKLGAYSMLTTTAVVLNHVKIGKQVFLGAGSIIGDNVVIDDLAVVGMGAVVASNVGRNKFVLGNPARMLGEADSWV